MGTLGHLAGKSNPLPKRRNGGHRRYRKVLRSRERELGVDVRFGLAVRASGLAGLGAGAERLFDDGFDSACTPATFDAAPEAAIDLPGVARKIFRRADGAADIVVAEDVAGADNHENARTLC